jgi:hypothetical protein
MSRARNHGGGVIAVMLLTLAACATTPKSVPQPPAAAVPALDASYDWHGLLLLPFGSVLKDAPFTLHEVLMFRDAAHAAPSDDAECYAIEQTAPRFLARTPSEYLLCFRHDHLARVDATVALPQEEAAAIFSDACALWQRSAGAVQTGAGLPGAEPTETVSAATAGASACDGRDGAIAYSGRLEENVDRVDRALTIRLDALTQR